MPRQKSIKKNFAEAIVFIGVLALVGHLSVNFWERFIIQSEVTHIKKTLNSLKETLANIGNAYDSLHKELRAILEEITENKHCPTPSKSTQLYVSRPNYKPKSKYTLDRRRLHDAQVKATLFDKNNDIRVAKVNKTTENAIFKKNKSLEAFLKQPVINATTITRYPLKSTGVGHQEPVECSARETCIRYKNMVSDKHACCKFHHEHCCNNWKY